MPEPDICPICGETAPVFGRARVLDRTEATFRRCPACWCVFAQDPTWLGEAYQESIAERDIGLVSRNIELAGTIQRILSWFASKATSFLDFGAGNGMFVRIMRDRGFDFRYVDPHGPNLYAVGFEVNRPPDPGAEVVTALEVVEHLVDPVEELRPYVCDAEMVLISTTLIPEEAPPLERWWYYSLESGQHITILSPRSLQVLASRLGFTARSIGNLHLLTRRPVSRWRVRLAARLPLALIPPARRHTSLLDADFDHLFGRRLG